MSQPGHQRHHSEFALKQGGAGLGLAIVRGIARSHSGDVNYEAGGFVIRLPLQAAASTPVAAERALTSGS